VTSRTERDCVACPGTGNDRPCSWSTLWSTRRRANITGKYILYHCLQLWFRLCYEDTNDFLPE